MAGAASQAGDADSSSSRAPGLTSGLQGSVNVHRGALLLVPQWRCISSFVFYIEVRLRNWNDQQIDKNRKRKRSDSVLWQKPLHPHKIPKSNIITHKQNATKNFDYTTIVAVSWSNDSHPTGVIKPVYGIPTFQLTAKSV